MTTESKDLVVVTGGSRGIGKAVVEALANSGYPVVFTYVSSQREAEEFCARLDIRGNNVAAYQCDGRDSKQVDRLKDIVLERHGTPHALINNSGVVRDSLLMAMQEAQWHEVIASNLDSTFNVTRAFLPDMLTRRRGAVLQMSSVSAQKGNPGQTNYSATKAGMVGFTKSLALEVARFNLRVNSILPGYIDTEMVQGMPDDRRKAIEKQIPLRRMGRPEEVAGLVKYLISDDAAYITGQAFIMDGGLSV